MHDREREGRRRGCDALWQMNQFYWSIGQRQRWFYPVTFKTLPSISKCFAVKGILLGRVLLYTSVLTPLLPGHVFNNSKGWKRLLLLYWKWTQVCIIVCILCWSWPLFFMRRHQWNSILVCLPKRHFNRFIFPSNVTRSYFSVWTVQFSSDAGILWKYSDTILKTSDTKLFLLFSEKKKNSITRKIVLRLADKSVKKIILIFPLIFF